MRASRVAQVVKHLPSKLETLSLNSSMANKKRRGILATQEAEIRRITV
jgi:hypothetical protein